jgi:hypothetical protein
MASDNWDAIGSPSRRALLKAAAGGVFAAPLIASFSMDTASARTTAHAQHSSNQVIVSNMFCSNMTSVPTSVFFAALQRIDHDGNPAGPAVGEAAIEFERGGDALHYQVAVNGRIESFTVSLTYSGSFRVDGRSPSGTIPSSRLGCGPDSMSTVYNALSEGGSVIDVELADGIRLQGTFFRLSQGRQYQGRLTFGGRP